MRCEDVKLQLLDVVDGAEPGAELQEHLKHCTSCQEHLRMLHRHRELLHRVPAPAAPDVLWDRVESALVQSCPAVHPLRWWAAAAAAVLLALGLGLMLPRLLTSRPATTSSPSLVASTQGSSSEVGSTDRPAVTDLVDRHDVLEQGYLLNGALVTQTEQARYQQVAEEMP